MSLAEHKFLHALNLLPELGPVRLMNLHKRFGSFSQAYQGSADDLAKVGFDKKLIDRIISQKRLIDPEAEIERLLKHKIKTLSYFDQEYPTLLKQISKAPPLLYYRGALPDRDELSVAMVGTRKITNYGRMAAQELAEPLAQAGICLVSGLAFGVDAAAHQAAVKQESRTIAVLGGGLDDASLYPRHHVYLADQILDKGGTLISEYPIGTPNFKQNFIARNRIISGLSIATIIIECDLKSGTLITAKYALEQNRQVFAVPGSIFSPQSQGPNNLLKMGAKPITCAKDLFEDLNLGQVNIQKQTQNEFSDTQEEKILLSLIQKSAITVNELIKISGLAASAVTSTLTFLEMKGRVRNLGGQQYINSR